MFRLIRNFTRTIPSTSSKRFGSSGGGHNHEPHVPIFYDRMANFFMLTMWLTVMFRAKDNKGAFLNLYQPWLHPHEHHDHGVKYVDTGLDTMPAVAEGEDEHDEE